MQKYTKIETIYKRDVGGTKHLIEGEFRNKLVEYLKDSKWYGTEKIDGTNIGIVWDGHRVTFQGRTERAELPKHLIEKLHTLFSGVETEELFEQLFGEKQVILFGEGFGAKIQSGGSYISNDCDFILFDVYMVDSDTWLTRESIESIATTFNIRVVPVVFEGTLDEAVAYVKSHPKSTIGVADMEGIVCKPLVDCYDRNHDRLIIKIKWEDFKHLV